MRETQVRPSFNFFSSFAGNNARSPRGLKIALMLQRAEKCVFSAEKLKNINCHKLRYRDRRELFYIKKILKHQFPHIFINEKYNGLTSRHDPGHEYPGVLLLVLVQPPVDEGEAEAAAAAVHHDRARLEADDHTECLEKREDNRSINTKYT